MTIKFRDRFNQIAHKDKEKPRFLRVLIVGDYGTKYLRIDTTYKTSDCSVSYIEKNIFIGYRNENGTFNFEEKTPDGLPYAKFDKITFEVYSFYKGKIKAETERHKKTIDELKSKIPYELQ